jgi:NADH:ubiquinone oxidoreductase subunit E
MQSEERKMTTSASTALVARWQRDLGQKFDAAPRNMIPALQHIQSEAGYLPPEAMTALARHLRVSEAKVYGVASFYSLFHFEPRGSNTVTVCRGTACHVRGSSALLRELEKVLGIQAGGTSEDMLFSLQTVACFGSCALAPVVVVNDKVYGRQTTASVKKLVMDVRAGAVKARTGAKASKRRAPAKQGGRARRGA